MIEQIYNYFTIETLYYWLNFGVLPFWLVLIFFPQSSFCKYFVTSIFPILILSGTYIFLIYKSYLAQYDFNGNFNLYLGINEISDLFSNKLFLILRLGENFRTAASHCRHKPLMNGGGPICKQTVNGMMYILCRIVNLVFSRI